MWTIVVLRETSGGRGTRRVGTGCALRYFLYTCVHTLYEGPKRSHYTIYNASFSPYLGVKKHHKCMVHLFRFIQLRFTPFHFRVMYVVKSAYKRMCTGWYALVYCGEENGRMHEAGSRFSDVIFPKKTSIH